MVLESKRSDTYAFVTYSIKLNFDLLHYHTHVNDQIEITLAVIDHTSGPHHLALRYPPMVSAFAPIFFFSRILEMVANLPEPIGFQIHRKWPNWGLLTYIWITLVFSLHVSLLCLHRLSEGKKRMLLDTYASAVMIFIALCRSSRLTICSFECAWVDSASLVRYDVLQFI